MSEKLDTLWELQITEQEAGERLDRILSARELGVSRSVLQRWMLEGRVCVNGKPASAKSRPKAYARVSIAPLPQEPLSLQAENIPLHVLFEDEHLLVIDKPAGLVVHPAAGHTTGTLVNAVLYGRTVAESDAPFRPGIVHRLDKDTSGVMVIAKTAAAREGLIPQFKTHTIERRYWAFVAGHPRDVVCDTLFGRHPIHRKRFSGKVKQGKRALTHVHVLERLHATAWVECKLETGRTHQIRVHLSEHGHAVLADALYGKRTRDPVVREAEEILGRQALHAYKLGFTHPLSGERLDFSAPLPAEMQQALDLLKLSAMIYPKKRY